MLFKGAVDSSSVVGVTMRRLKVPFADVSYIEPGFRTKQPRSWGRFTSRAKHLDALFNIKIFGTIGSVANCCNKTESTLTLSDDGFNG